MRLTISPQTLGVQETRDDETNEVTSRTVVFTEHIILPNGMQGPPFLQVDVGPYGAEDWAKLVDFINSPTEVAAREEAAAKIVTPGGPLH